MKRTLILSAAAALAISAAAQNPILSNPERTSHWGIRAAWEGSFPSMSVDGTDLDMFRSGSGLSVGAVYELPLVANLYLQPGLSLYYNTYRYDMTLITDSETGEGIDDPSVKKFGFRIPVYVGYHFDFFENGGIHIFTGPQASIGVTSTLGIDDDMAKELDLTTNLYDGTQRRFDIAWTIGAGLQIGRWQIDVAGSFGMMDICPGPISQHEKRISVGLGYNF